MSVKCDRCDRPARYRSISKGLMCQVCYNRAVDDIRGASQNLASVTAVADPEAAALDIDPSPQESPSVEVPMKFTEIIGGMQRTAAMGRLLDKWKAAKAADQITKLDPSSDWSQMSTENLRAVLEALKTELYDRERR